MNALKFMWFLRSLIRVFDVFIRHLIIEFYSKALIKIIEISDKTIFVSNTKNTAFNLVQVSQIISKIR